MPVLPSTPRRAVRRRSLNYASTDPVPEHRWADRELIDGNIVQALRVLLERFDRLVPNPFALEADGVTRRAHGPHFPLLREALVNLLVHQDHGDHRIARVLWYRDRVVFDNPGDSLVPLDDLVLGGVTATRNPLIQRTIRMAQLAEQAGLGVVTLRERWTALTGQAPVFRSDPAWKTFAVDFPWKQDVEFGGDPAPEVAPEVAPEDTPELALTPEVAPEVTPEVVRMLAVREGELTRQEIQARLGLSDEKHFREHYQQPAVAAGLVAMTIPDKPRSSRQRYRLTAAGRALRADVERARS
jgi:predicted HTH transcriptional regulator